MTGNLNMSQKKIINCALPSDVKDVSTKGYVDTEVAKKPNVNQVVLRDGSQNMTGNLNMSQKKIINCALPSDVKDVSTKGYVDTEVAKKPNVNQVVLRDGTQDMTGNLNMNNFKITNVKDATNNQDVTTLKQVSDAIATTSTNNNKYTDQKLAESHISTHENRKNVLAYAMDDGEFTEDFGIQDVNLITYNDSPHKTNKKAFPLKVQKTNDGSSLFKGRFDFNLFKMIRDDFSDNYTVCIEVYFINSRQYDSEFNSFNISFEKLNMNIDKSHTIKISTSEYKYYRSILNLSPDGISTSIQRRLYVNVQSNYDNFSPQLLPLYVLIYGIKGEAKNDLDMTIYDYEKAYEVANNKFQLHVPIEMNGNKILGLSASISDKILPSYIWGRTLRSSFRCEFQNPILSTLILDSIHIVSIKIFAQSTYLSSTNHVLIVQADKIATYDLNFSTNKTITVNMNRSYQNVDHIHIQFNDNVVKVFKFKIKYKTFSP